MSKIRTGIKMWVTPGQSRKVQEICFENGIYWRRGKNIGYFDEPFLFIEEYISFIFRDQEDFFVKAEEEEVDADLFIRTNGTCIEDNKDMINPEHYKTGGIETIDYMKAKSTPEEFRGHLRLTALKYLSRYGQKDNELQELKKAKWYLDRLIIEIEENGETK